jgi:hypothetical protein
VNEQLMTSIVSGIAAGVVSLMVGGLVLRFFMNKAVSDIDLDLYYEALDQLKREDDEDIENEGRSPARTAIILLCYGAAIAVIMAIVVRISLSLPLESSLTLPVLLLIWLLLTALPLGFVLFRKSKRLAILEIASIIELIAKNPDEQEEAWVVHCTKRVAGGDIFGADEEDMVDFRLFRKEVAPITLGVSGHIRVAEAGLGRTVRKSVLRQLRLTGWFVNEIRDTEAELERVWSLHDSTYAEIANYLAWVLESLGFPLRNVRLSKANLDIGGVGELI